MKLWQEEHKMKERIKKIGKTLAKILIPGTLIVPFIMENKKVPMKDQTDGMEAFEALSYGANLFVISAMELSRVAAYVAIGYQLLK
jgi:hypothetical protein